MIPPTSTLPLASVPSAQPNTVLPSRKTAALPSQDWIVTQHYYPAAYPRSRVDCSTSQRPLKSYSLTPQRKDAAQVAKELSDMEHTQNTAAHSRATDLQSPPLFIAVNRYTPRKPLKGKGLTLLLEHANGLHKETWEPTINHLLTNLRKTSAVDIEEVWAFDVVNQGDSAVLNADRLGSHFDWIDVGRDIANFVLRYLPPRNCTALPALEAHEAHPALCQLDPSALPLGIDVSNWRGRQLVCIGHSVGGAGMTACNSFLPSGLIKALFLVDPVLTPDTFADTNSIYPLTKGALIRKEAWKDRETALTGWKKNKGFFGRWDPAVLERYAAFGLKDTSDGLVALKMDREQEALTFLDPELQGSRGSWAKLARVPSTVRTHFILADGEESVLFGRSIKPDMLLVQGAHLKPTLRIMKGVGHLITQEAPDQLAEEIGQKLIEWFGARAFL